MTMRKGQSEITILQGASEINEQNSHSDVLLVASLMVALIVLVLGYLAACWLKGWLNDRERE